MFVDPMLPVVLQKNGLPLSYAEMLDALLERGVPEPPFGCLAVAARHGQLDIMAFLLKQMQKERNITCALLKAIEHHRKDSVEFLVQNGANVNKAITVRKCFIYTDVSGP